MIIQTIVKKNAYYDSVTLMLLSRELKKLEGVEEILVGMGTDLNIELVQNLGLFSGEKRMPALPVLANQLFAEQFAAPIC